jgi:DNA-binding transcriptional MocR family regulator
MNAKKPATITIPPFMAYGDPAGLLTLREAVAQYLRTARAVNYETSQVLIVSGSQMALKPGDEI